MPKSTPSETFGVRLRRLREQREISQSELARRALVQPSAIAHFEAERRKPSFENIRSLAKALSVTTDMLMGSEAVTAFRNEEKLTLGEREMIQNLIDTMAQKKK